MGPVALIIVVVKHNLVRGVEGISRLPVRVGHPELFPSEVVLVVGVVSSILQQVSVTEAEVSGGEWGLPRPDKLAGILLNGTTFPGWHAVLSELILRHGDGRSFNENILAVAILRILLTEWARINGEDRLVTCISAVKHVDHLGVPILYAAMVTVKLKLVGLALVMTLELCACVVAVFGVFVRHLLHEDRRRVR